MHHDFLLRRLKLSQASAFALHGHKASRCIVCRFQSGELTFESLLRRSFNFRRHRCGWGP
jgi:hypothetical protein